MFLRFAASGPAVDLPPPSKKTTLLGRTDLPEPSPASKTKMKSLQEPTKKGLADFEKNMASHESSLKKGLSELDKATVEFQELAGAEAEMKRRLNAKLERKAKALEAAAKRGCRKAKENAEHDENNKSSDSEEANQREGEEGEACHEDANDDAKSNEAEDIDDINDLANFLVDMSPKDLTSNGGFYIYVNEGQGIAEPTNATKAGEKTQPANQDTDANAAQEGTIGGNDVNDQVKPPIVETPEVPPATQELINATEASEKTQPPGTDADAAQESNTGGSGGNNQVQPPIPEPETPEAHESHEELRKTNADAAKKNNIGAHGNNDQETQPPIHQPTQEETEKSTLNEEKHFASSSDGAKGGKDQETQPPNERTQETQGDKENINSNAAKEGSDNNDQKTQPQPPTTSETHDKKETADVRVDDQDDQAWREQDYYSMLNIPQTVQDVKKAYKKVSLVAHPDKGGSNQRFQRLQLAFETLADDAKRSLYDASLQAAQSTSQELDDFFAGLGNPTRNPKTPKAKAKTKAKAKAKAKAKCKASPKKKSGTKKGTAEPQTPEDERVKYYQTNQVEVDEFFDKHAGANKRNKNTVKDSGAAKRARKPRS
ncbi:unnamed protein product [Durusdinium trenchii]|uniref:J domain-containing protein n=1 Tax=Durusdinium trenchii TaxID=1381693 RepID=A0ABP0Q463_9DINO